jgi:hypothetical protein
MKRRASPRRPRQTQKCETAGRLPQGFKLAALRLHVRPTRFVLAVSVAAQRMALFEMLRSNGARLPDYALRRHYLISTSRFGTGQVMHSNQTPLGLHRIARKTGGGQPIGTVFKARQPVGLTWQGMTDGAIVHRILWLEGLEPGFNRGGDVDSFRRYIYIHGFGDETTLGRPQSCGCVHLAAADLMPLYERLPVGTLVWIGER